MTQMPKLRLADGAPLRLFQIVVIPASIPKHWHITKLMGIGKRLPQMEQSGDMELVIDAQKEIKELKRAVQNNPLIAHQEAA